MVEKDTYILDFLNDDNNHYLINNNYNLREIRKFYNSDFCLYNIQELTFEDKAPRKEALENVLSSLRLEGVNFLYLIIGDKKGVHFYFGVAEDLTNEIQLKLEIDDIGDNILKPSINGNFRGSKVLKLDYDNKKHIKEKLDDMNYFGVVEGVPGINEDSEDLQGVDRLVDVMLGDEFCISIIASPIDRKEIINIENNLYKIYSNISPLVKDVFQDGTSKGTSESTSEAVSISTSRGTTYNKTDSKGSSQTETKGISSNTSESRTDSKGKTSGTSEEGANCTTNKSVNEGTTNQKSSGTSEQQSHGDTINESSSVSNGENISKAEGKSNTTGNTVNQGTSISKTTEYLNREAQEWLKYLDEVLIPRLDYGKSKGIFITSTFIATKNKASLIKLGNTMKSLYSGKQGNKIPLEFYIVDDKKYLNYYRDFQIPMCDLDKSEEILPRAVISQYMMNNKLKFGNWLSTNELSLIAGLPQKEIVGLSLKEEIDFGLNIKKEVQEENSINIGRLVQSGNILNIDICIDKENLNKHMFVTGVTGSGKTTTCQKILADSGLPFLVIEPAKTEYRVLSEYYDDMIVFTLGKDNIAPFRLNPFEFYEHENISSRVDMIKACLEASFDMEAAIPQIIETSIYECYEDYGWNIATNKNYKFTNPFENGVYAFPTLSDLMKKIESVVIEQGFDERLKRDYIGSIKARLQSLTVGSKGLMLDTKRSINFNELLNIKVVLELEEIKNVGEKSLVMGFILINLNEAIKANFNKDNTFRHITLVEEAHRLLSKYEYGDSLNKKQGVEVFSDMLAEVRKYGESLIIAEQIPNKLTSEVLKNTNTKIVHKIFAKDDKDAIGNTMSLNDEQKEFLSSLDVGRAIVFTQGWDKAIQVQINANTKIHNEHIISEEKIKEKALKFYKKKYKTGVLTGIEELDDEPSLEFIQEYLRFIQEGIFEKEYKLLFTKKTSKFDFINYMNNFKNIVNSHLLSNYILRCFYKEDDYERKYIIEVFLDKLLDGDFTNEGITNIDRETFLKLKVK